MDIITLKEAKSLGLKKYYTGKPCPKGHLSERYVYNSCCIQCAKEAGKSWYLRNNRDDDFMRDRKIKSIKSRCKAKGIPFDLTVESLEWPTHCPVLGIELEYGGEDREAKRNSPSIDRLYPDLGYVRGNCKVISMAANQLKSDATIEELEKVLTYMKDNMA